MGGGVELPWHEVPVTPGQINIGYKRLSKVQFRVQTFNFTLELEIFHELLAVTFHCLSTKHIPVCAEGDKLVVIQSIVSANVSSIP